MLHKTIYFSVLFQIITLQFNQAADDVRFERATLTEEFHSEGASFADINSDGKMDLVSGPFWYAGPDFFEKVRYTAGESLSIKGYSKHFFTWTFDFNKDGHVDILTVGMPGEPAYWFENPCVVLNEKNEEVSSPNWKRREAIDNICNESPEFTDITGDGVPDLVCIRHGAYGYVEHQFEGDAVSFRFTAITPNRGLGRFTHGMGIGDVDSDGRMDLLETNGWWKQTETKGQLFEFHPFRFAQSGGAQMFAYDFDGDGDNDVISSQNAHGYGLTWFEQKKSGTNIDFVPHKIMTDNPQENPFGLAFSQMHGLALVDVDHDGVKDIVTGKRYWAHGGADPGAKQLPILFWLKTVRKKGRVLFEPKLIDERSGVGTQVTTGDVNGDKKIDILIGNKLGTYLFVQRSDKQASSKDWSDIPLNVGSTEFNENVRTTEPLSPREQQKTFVLPPGFRIELVAAEPQIAKPMNIAFGPKGRLWVSSSLEYPFAATDPSKARDAIKILEDTNNDGLMNKVTTFADKLNIPMGLLPYKNGVICFSIPNIWFLSDTDNDGKADKREILYGPFDTTRDTHGMCSSFTDGKDGWIYACHGFNNQSKVSGKDGHEVQLNSGNVFRFKPDGSRIEIVTHGQVNPFGLTIDSNGDIFTADCHTKPINLILPGGHHDSFGKPHDGLGYIPNVMEHLHDSTGIGGIALGEYTRFPNVYKKSTFGGNVVTGRINRNHLVYSGSSMTAREESDFLIPGDPWFRPVNLQVGPDGALYIADFYNAIIGHYEVDLNHPKRDRRRGRIWRVVATNENRKDLAFASEKSEVIAVDSVQSKLEEFRKLANQKTLVGKQPVILTQGLGSENPLVRRFAVMAIAQHSEFDYSTQLVGLLAKTPASDRYLVHAIKIALREQLKDHDQRFVAAAKLIPESIYQPFADICMAIQSEPAAKFVVDKISQLSSNDAAKLTTYLEFVSQYGSTDSLFSIVSIAQKRFENDIDFQLTLLDGIRIGLTKRGEKLTPSVRQWATSIADKLFGPIPSGPHKSDEVLSWSYYKDKTAVSPSDSENIFIQSNRRNSADGMVKTPLWSSIVKGEQQTGVYRSEPFGLSNSLSFYLAGHDGVPDKPLGNLNYAQLRLAATNQVIRKSSPPRNDTAQKIVWDTNKFVGQLAVMELVDQDSSGAYAWLAAGRFSQTGLNPSKKLQNQKQAAQIVEQFGLTNMRKKIVDLLANSNGGQLAESLCSTLIALDSKSNDTNKVESAAVFRASSMIQSLPNVDVRSKKSAIQAIISGDLNAAKKVLGEVSKTASASQQNQFANVLVGDKTGAKTLVKMIDNGFLSPAVFSDSRLVDTIQAHDDQAISKAVDAFAANLPKTDATAVALMKQRIESFVAKAPDILNGAKVFEKNCANCHQVVGKGKQVGPNLDGIGARGLDRLAEDILQPNRNVDAAFRASLIGTDDGRVFNGFVKKSNDDSATHLTLVDTTGKDILIAKEQIENQKETRSSPMPNNFGETLSENDFRDLIGFLMSNKTK